MKNLKLDLLGANPLNKIEIKARAAKDAQSVLDLGTKSPMEIYATGRKVVEYINSFLGVIEPGVRAEVDSYGREGANLAGVKFELSSTGERLNYSQDPEWTRLSKELKDREAMLKMARTNGIQMADVNGEVVPRVELKSASREVLRLKF